MSDPYGPEQWGPSRQGSEPTAPRGNRYPPYTDPAYAGQTPTYGLGYVSPYAANPTEQLPQQHWQQGQPPTGEPPELETPPPAPPNSPRWLWILAAAALLLVVGLVIALVIANGAAKKQTAVPPLPAISSTTTPSRAPTNTSSPSLTTTTTPSTTTSPTETTSSSATGTVVYSVTGQGHALSIAYIGTGGVLQTEFNVVLPWSKEVSLTSTASKASVTIINVGQEITCSLTVNGTQVRQHTGSFLTICAAG